MKKAAALFLTLCMIALLGQTAFALEYGEVNPMCYVLDLSQMKSGTGATVINGGISLSAGGSAVYDVSFGYQTATVKFTCEAAAAGQVTITADGTKDYSIDVKKGYSAQSLTAAISGGAHELKISSSSAVTIKSMTVNYKETINTYTSEYAGPTVYVLDLSSCTMSENANVSSGGVTINAGGKASFDMFFDADVEDVSVTYKNASSGTLTVSTGKKSCVFQVNGSDTQKKSFSERCGSHTVTLSSSANVTVTSVTFHKAKIEGISNRADLQIEYGEYDKAMQTAVVVSDQKIALKVNGAFRYLDYDDTAVSPINIDGRLYLPIHAAARAFSLYYEDYPDKNYAYLSNDNFELYQKNGECYVIKNGKKEYYGRFMVYSNGTAWVPFRQLAELLGETVVWRCADDGDGFAIADDRIRAEAIVSNDDVFRALTDEFAQFDIKVLDRNNTYYVSQSSGSDENDGLSEETPFKTIQKAADLAQAGDTVIIHEGVYRETVTPQNGGMAAQPVIFKAAEGEDVTISAFEKVSGFTKYLKNKKPVTHNGYDLYTVKIPSMEKVGNEAYQAANKNLSSWSYGRNFIIKDDEILREGRYPDVDTKPGAYRHPNANENVMRATMGNIAMPSPSAVSGKTFTYSTSDGNVSKQYEYDFAVSDTDLNQTKNFWKDGMFVTQTGEGYTLSFARIDASDNHIGDNDNTGWIHLVDNQKGGYDFVGPNAPYYTTKEPDDYGYITHHIETVTQPGEWYVSGTTLYIIPPEGVAGEDLEVETKVRQRVIDLRDKKFIQFKNINTRGGGITMAGDTEMNIINGGTHKYISQIDWTAAHATHDGRYCENKNTDCWEITEDGPELGEVGFFAGGKNNAFVNTNIYYSAFAGIYVTGKYSYIENNYIENAGYMGPYPGAITLERCKGANDASEPTHGGHTVVENTCVGSGRANLYLSNGFSDKYETCYSPYIACDMSYNRLEMGSICTKDTGNFYATRVSAGNDLIKTGLHHNVVCDIGTKADHSFMNALIYHDGYASFMETYSNVALYTAPEYVETAIYQHRDKNSAFINYLKKWGNVDLGLVTGGIGALTYKDYPYGKPFNAGAVRDGDSRFMLNYDRVSENNIRLAENNTLPGGSSDATTFSSDIEKVSDDGFVDLNSKDSTVTFHNVVCGSKGTELSLYYAGDKYEFEKQSKAVINSYNKTRKQYIPEITFTFDYGNRTKEIKAKAFAQGEYLDNQARLILYLDKDMAGVCDVTVSVSQNENGDPIFIRPDKLVFADIDYEAKATSPDCPYPYDGTTILLGSFDSWVSGGDALPVYLKTDDELIDKGTNWMLHETYSRKPIYKNRRIEKDSSKISMRFSTGGQYSYCNINIYVQGKTDSGTTVSKTLVKKINIQDYVAPQNEQWKTVILTENLDQTVKAGTYDIYVEYQGYGNAASGQYGTTDSHWISFHNGETFNISTGKVNN
ncbi:MAG: hypothetical protein J5590_03985 [Clostridia bacterium]|nr:hypothetical protein [Clostridia bacterium]